MGILLKFIWRLKLMPAKKKGKNALKQKDVKKNTVLYRRQFFTQKTTLSQKQTFFSKTFDHNALAPTKNQTKKDSDLGSGLDHFFFLRIVRILVLGF